MDHLPFLSLLISLLTPIMHPSLFTISSYVHAPAGLSNNTYLAENNILVIREVLKVDAKSRCVIVWATAVHCNAQSSRLVGGSLIFEWGSIYVRESKVEGGF
jgi:hypothetical protein